MKESHRDRLKCGSRIGIDAEVSVWMVILMHIIRNVLLEQCFTFINWPKPVFVLKCYLKEGFLFINQALALEYFCFFLQRGINIYYP